MSLINWGDVPTWVGAGFAAAAAGAAVWTLKSQRDQIGEQRVFIGEQSATLALEREALRAAAEDRKWQQARQVRMDFHKAGERTDGEGNVEQADHWIVTVLNASEAPVHGVEVRFGTAHRSAEVYECQQHVGGAWLPVDRVVAPVHLLGPRRVVRFLSQRWPSPTVHNNRPLLVFTDDDGIRWVQDSCGKLEEAPPEPW